MDKKKEARVLLTGLWEGKTQNGAAYLSGTLSPSAKLLIFRNGFQREGTNDPTHQLYVVPVTPREGKKSNEQEEVAQEVVTIAEDLAA